MSPSGPLGRLTGVVSTHSQCPAHSTPGHGGSGIKESYTVYTAAHGSHTAVAAPSSPPLDPKSAPKHQEGRDRGPRPALGRADSQRTLVEGTSGWGTRVPSAPGRQEWMWTPDQRPASHLLCRSNNLRGGSTFHGNSVPATSHDTLRVGGTSMAT